MRWTKKDDKEYKLIDYIDELSEEEVQLMANQKLSEIEDIEEEIGLDILGISYILKTGIYKKTEKGLIEIPGDDLSLSYDKNKFIVKSSKFGIFDFKDYGETWAISRGELELPF